MVYLNTTFAYKLEDAEISYHIEKYIYTKIYYIKSLLDSFIKTNIEIVNNI